MSKAFLNGPVYVGNARPIRFLFFHLLNHSQIVGAPVYCETSRSYVAGRVSCESDKWKVVLDPVPDLSKLSAALKDVGGHVISHIGRLERLDGALFSSEDASDCLDALYYFFSFCAGRWTAPILELEFDDAGDLCRETWGVRTSSAWRHVSSWFTDRGASMMPALFPGFMKRWHQPLWNDALRRSIWWYISGNLQAGGIDGGIILAQVALELLAWVMLVEDGHVVSRRGFEDLPAADKLRLLLDRMHVPLTVPGSLPSLAAFGPPNIPYGPFKFVEIRNAMVHPKNRTAVDRADDAVVEAWELGLWYTELAILFACGYSGSYVNRNVVQWAGEVEPVPWD